MLDIISNKKGDTVVVDVLLMYVNEEDSEEDKEDEASDEDKITEKEEKDEVETEDSADSYFTEIEEDSFQIYDKFIQGSSPTPSILDARAVDYEELFSYLGQRITQNSYENTITEKGSVIEKISPTVIPVSTETIEKGIKKVKYFTPGDVTMDSPIPYEGMTSEEYDKFRLWKVLNPAMAKFFMDFL